MDELNPMIQEIVKKPLAFVGGFVSGLLRLSPENDPFASYLCNDVEPTNPIYPKNGDPSNGNGPQTIDIE